MLTRLSKMIRKEAPLISLWLIVAAYYVFVISAGHFTRWHVWSAFYEAQAEGLLAGHLYLPEAPSPALMALKNPYDLANMPYWRWDHSYYQGHLYLYWGLVPAFIAAGIKMLFRTVVPDNSLTFAFCIIRLVAGTLLIRDVARAAAHRQPRWVVTLAMLVFALANPTPYTLARAGIYEAAIMGGVAFMMAGLWFGYRALIARGAGGANAWLAAASLSFGLAAGSRLSLIPTAGALCVLTGLWCWRQPRPSLAGARQGVIGAGVAALAPAGAVVLVLMICNHLRFGAWTEFGRSYVMTYPYFLPGLRFLLPDSYAYAFAPAQWTCTFPYLSATWSTLRTTMPSWLPITWPPDHHSPEPTIGLLAAAPFVVLAPIAAVAALGRLRILRRSGVRRISSSISWAAVTARRNWLWIALVVYVAGAAPFMILNVTTMRYEHDYASAILLLATFGAWRLLAAPSTPTGRRAMTWLYVALAASTIIIGVLLGFGGYFKHFEHHNPALLHALQSTLSFCRSPR
jgi:hypothetical protein